VVINIQQYVSIDHEMSTNATAGYLIDIFV